MRATTDTFPVDWNEWRAEWDRWRATSGVYRHRGKNPFGPKNFLADDVLGVYVVNGRVVELSEVTFPNLTDRDDNGRLIEQRYRYVGVTFSDGATDLAQSFTDLERILGV